MCARVCVCVCVCARACVRARPTDLLDEHVRSFILFSLPPIEGENLLIKSHSIFPYWVLLGKVVRLFLCVSCLGHSISFVFRINNSSLCTTQKIIKTPCTVARIFKNESVRASAVSGCPPPFSSAFFLEKRSKWCLSL